MTLVLSLPVFGYIARNDVKYDEVDGAPLFLDVFTPSKKSNSPMPSLFFIHGGCFSMGSRKDIPEEIKKLADDGFTVFAVQYRLAPKAVYPAALEDVRAAIRYVRKNADSFNIDPERISAHGESAGGYLAAMVGLRLLRDRNGVTDESSAPVASVSDWFGRTDFTATQTTGTDCAEVFLGKKRTAATLNEFKAASATSIILKKPAKFLIIHGSRDQQVYPVHSANLANRLWRQNSPAAFYYHEGSGHGFPHTTAWQLTRSFLMNLAKPSGVFENKFSAREIGPSHGRWGLDLVLDNKDRAPVVLDARTFGGVVSGTIGVISPTSAGKVEVKTELPEDRDSIDLQ